MIGGAGEYNLKNLYPKDYNKITVDKIFLVSKSNSCSKNYFNPTSPVNYNGTIQGNFTAPSKSITNNILKVCNGVLTGTCISYEGGPNDSVSCAVEVTAYLIL